METDYYLALGVERNASSLDIKSAYRRLVRLHHPDANPHNRVASEARMKEVLEAYSTLSDPHKRTHYDNARKLRDFEKSQNANENRAAQRAGSTDRNAADPTNLMGKVRVVLGESSASFAAQLGLSETDLQVFEERDAMPQAALQQRTFANLVERAARKLEAAGRFTEAGALRSAFERKKNNRNFMR